MGKELYDSSQDPESQDQVEYYSKLTEYLDGLYYIDFSTACLFIVSSKKETFDWKEIRKLLGKIGGIKLDRWHIITDFTEDSIPFTIIKMLIERIVSFNGLEIDGQNISIQNDNLSSVVEECDMASKQKDAFQKLKWRKNEAIDMIKLEKCPKEVIECCLKTYSAYDFSDIHIIESPNIKEIDLSMMNIKRERRVWFTELPQLESIIFPVEKTDIECPVIILTYLPELKKIANFDTFISSGVLLCELHVDWKIFKTIEKACRRTTEDLLITKTLEIYGMPYPPEDLETLPHCPWIHVDNLRILVSIPHSYLTIEDQEKKSYSADAIRNVGINLLEGAEYIGRLELPENFKSYQSEFIGKLMGNNNDRNAEYFICYKCLADKCLDLDISDISIYEAPIGIDIHLENFEEIQEAIAKFRSKYTSICDHILYRSIQIKGAANPVSKNKQIELLIDILSCLGEKIWTKYVYFYDMEGPVMSEIQEKLLTIPKTARYNFQLKAVYFYRSELEFIEFMLTQYTYCLSMKITIDCGKFNGEDTWRLINIAMKLQPQSIRIHNAFEFMQEVSIEKYTIDNKLKKKLCFMPLDFKRAVKNFQVSEDIFQQGFYVNPLTFPIVIRNIKNITSGKSQIDSQLLIYEMCIENACVFLKNVTEIVDSVKEIKLYMCNSDPNAYTTLESLCEFFTIVAKVFVNMESLHMEYLCIKKENDQDENLYQLQSFLSEKKMNKLWRVTLINFTLIDSENPSANEEKPKQHTQCFRVGEGYMHHELSLNL
ncbi:hypothetical protein NEFER02_1808 [Nematocida sp. LUAm2]|nr:hypothetical protein NEFER02_1808 [Nematocida sp. LUAm2]